MNWRSSFRVRLGNVQVHTERITKLKLNTDQIPGIFFFNRTMNTGSNFIGIWMSKLSKLNVDLQKIENNLNRREWITIQESKNYALIVTASLIEKSPLSKYIPHIKSWSAVFPVLPLSLYQLGPICLQNLVSDPCPTLHYDGTLLKELCIPKQPLAVGRVRQDVFWSCRCHSSIYLSAELIQIAKHHAKLKKTDCSSLHYHA